MTTTNKTVLLTGESPLYPELSQLVQSRGFAVIGLDEAERNETEILCALEVTNFDLDRKRAEMKKLDRILPDDIPILTTSLSITATEAASWTNHPERVIGFGTLVPLEQRDLIELASAMQTNQTTQNRAEAFIHALGKDTEIVNDEVGLVFPRILALIINEAVFTVMEKAATPEDIDIAMKKGTNYPYGPLEWADHIGLDEVFAIVRGLQRDLAEERYRPAPLLRKLVLAGKTGIRSGHGFYAYGIDSQETLFAQEEKVRG